MTIAEFNDAAPHDVRDLLLECCGSERWADAMLARRPVASLETLALAADEIWWALDSSDWLQAFARHPRIGEQGKLSAWSQQEQQGIASASKVTEAVLARRNREYESKFGWIFLTCATGKTANVMLAEVEDRLARDKNSELLTAAREQAKIMQLRLKKAILS